MKELVWLAWIARILVLVGGINWGFVGLFNINLVTATVGGTLARIVFIIVGVAALYLCYCIYAEKMKKPSISS